MPFGAGGVRCLEFSSESASWELLPSPPEFNDVVSYDSKWLMDDGVVLEPLVGNRVYHSLVCLDRTMVAVWGKAEEGEPAGAQFFWGLYMDFDQQ